MNMQRLSKGEGKAGRQRDYKANGLHLGGCEGDNGTMAGAKHQVPFRVSEFSYLYLTFRLTKGSSNEMQKSTCITSRRQIMKALVTIEAKAKPKLGQGEAKARPKLGQGEAKARPRLGQG